MDPLDANVVTAAAASVLVVALGLVLLLVHRRRARAQAQARAQAYEQRLAASAAQLERLGDRVEELSADVARAAASQRATARAARADEYVITTLADTLAGAGHLAATPDDAGLPASRLAAGRSARVTRPRLDLEGHLVGALARHRGTTAVRDRAVEIVVQGAALAHGVRRALRPDTLDRAAAEAHVARRRSRRLRRAEVREARKLVRVLRDVA
jgi:hypothetical protein